MEGFSAEDNDSHALLGSPLHPEQSNSVNLSFSLSTQSFSVVSPLCHIEATGEFCGRIFSQFQKISLYFNHLELLPPRSFSNALAPPSFCRSQGIHP